jgi:uncharacterized protein (TIGR02265 family)
MLRVDWENYVQRRVRGILFLDYVRMIRGQKNVDWSRHLSTDDHTFLEQQVEADAWYPMETFERFGIAIGRELAKGQLDAVRMWGRFQIHSVFGIHPTLIAAGDPRETLLRFQVLRKSFFDYDALEVTELGDTRATVAVAYQMSPEAEEQASHQTMGFIEGLLEAAGATSIHAQFRAKSWSGAPRTLIDYHWRRP